MIEKRLHITLCLVFILMLLFACDHGIIPVDYEFGQPPRVVYIAGVDTELDFSEATVITTLRNGWQHEDPFPVGAINLLTVEHNVDFNTPGIYKVEVLRHPGFVITFFVQVIDEEIFNELKSGAR